MNRQFKELAEQAGYPDYMTYGQDLILERFAELIVAKCVNVAMRAVSDDEPKEAWYLIQEHFGVEE
jgi:hypothetical protein